MIDSVRQQFDTVRSGHTLPETRAAMLAYLRGRSEFRSTGQNSQGYVWARFADGPLLVISDPAGTAPAGSKGPLRLAPTRAAAQPWQIPGPRQAHLYNGFGTYFTYFQKNDIGSMLSSAGYTVQGTGYSAPGSTVEALRNVSGDGVFYLAGHGITFTYNDGTDGFAVQTATKSDTDTLTLYAAELKSEDLVISICTNDWDSAAGKIISAEFLCVTTKFMRNNKWSFGQNSLVMVNSCSSMHMNQALRDAGASLVALWTDTTENDKMFPAAEAVFDRLLGANKADPVLPVKQRPFDYVSISDELSNAGITSFNLQPHNGGARTDLEFVHFDDSGSGVWCGTLAPSIMFVWAHEYEEKLYLYGIFGDNPGSDGQVTVGGSQLQVLEWARDDQIGMDKIVAKLPYEGAGSYGDVKVTVRQHDSNMRQLSFYEGDFKLTHDTGDGRKYVITHHLRFRVDLQSARAVSGEEPKFAPMNPQRIFADDKSTAKYESSGATVTPDGSLTWSGSGDMVNNINGQSSNKAFIASLWFDPANKKVRLSLSGVAENGIIQTVGSQSTPMTIIYGLDDFDGKEPNFPSYIETTLGADYGIEKTTRPATKVATYYSAAGPMLDTVKVEWDAIACQSPPRDDSGRALTLGRSVKR